MAPVCLPLRAFSARLAELVGGPTVTGQLQGHHWQLQLFTTMVKWQLPRVNFVEQRLNSKLSRGSHALIYLIYTDIMKSQPNTSMAGVLYLELQLAQ